MAAKNGPAPWNWIMVPLEVREPRMSEDVAMLELPDRWEYLGCSMQKTEGSFVEKKHTSSKTRGQRFVFKYRGFRPPIKDGEVILASIHMLKLAP